MWDRYRVNIVSCLHVIVRKSKCKEEWFSYVLRSIRIPGRKGTHALPTPIDKVAGRSSECRTTKVLCKRIPVIAFDIEGFSATHNTLMRLVPRENGAK